MKKKYILAGLLLVGGIAFIKFILPKLNKKRGLNFDFIEFEPKEFNRGQGRNRQPTTVQKDKSINKAKAERNYGDSFGGQQEVGSESPIGMGYV